MCINEGQSNDSIQGKWSFFLLLFSGYVFFQYLSCVCVFYRSKKKTCYFGGSGRNVFVLYLTNARDNITTNPEGYVIQRI